MKRPILWSTLVLVLVAALLVLRPQRLKENTLELNGRSVKYFSEGSGPSMVILASPEEDWSAVSQELSRHFSVTLIPLSDPPHAEEILQALKLRRFSLLSAAAATAGLKVAMEHKAWLTKMILINPDVLQYPTVIESAGLILWSRGFKGRTPEAQMKLTRQFKDVQMSIHPNDEGRLLQNDPKWIARKVSEFVAL